MKKYFVYYEYGAIGEGQIIEYALVVAPSKKKAKQTFRETYSVNDFYIEVFDFEKDFYKIIDIIFNIHDWKNKSLPRDGFIEMHYKGYINLS